MDTIILAQIVMGFVDKVADYVIVRYCDCPAADHNHYAHTSIDQPIIADQSINKHIIAN
jgi:hypothetical protein